jgi:hypothetical protein
MDTEGLDLIKRLCTQAGCIMEDASVLALMWDDEPTLEARLGALSSAADDIKVLVDAARVLARSVT